MRGRPRRSPYGSHAGSQAHRSLAALDKSGSTSRVLNLAAIARTAADDPDYAKAPMFLSPTLNTSLVVKHRLRANEEHLAGNAGKIVTKLIVPFSRKDLSLGGQSIIVGASGWEHSIEEFSRSREELERDMGVIDLLDRLPSLDPFLMREHLRRFNINVANCYFALTAADVERMRGFVSSEIQKLIRIAISGGSGIDRSKPTARLVEALLSTEVDERLEPLRATLMLNDATFREGVFGWRGFLYYKWSLNTLTRDLNTVIAGLATLKPTGPSDIYAQQYLDAAKTRLRHGIVGEMRDVMEALKVYDDAYRDLVVNSNPLAFREFLLEAPLMFITLGEKIGGISHICSFWNYRFPRDSSTRVSLDEAVDLLKDFEQSLCIRMD